MDMMTIRKMVMGQMASGARFIKGTFTVPDNTNTAFTLNFGETFSSYLYIIEMSDTSKQNLMQTDIDGIRCFAYTGISPNLEISNSETPYNNYYYRINPHTGALSNSYGGSTSGIVCTNTSIAFSTGNTSSSSARLYYGYTYNYYIVEIK